MKKKVNSHSQQGLLLVIVALFWFSQYIYIPQQTPYLTLAGLNTGFIGIIVGAYGISQMLLRLPVGVMADLAGKHKRFICLGSLSTGVACCLRILLPAAPGFLIGNLCSGLASAMWISFIVYYTGFSSAEEQQKATSQIILANNLGMLAGFVASTLLYEKWGMFTLCRLGICAGVIGLMLGLLGIKEEKVLPDDISATTVTANSTVTVSALLGICKNHKLIVFSLLAIIQQGIQMSTTMSFTTQILKDLGAAAAVIGLASIIYMVSAVCSSWFGGSAVCQNQGPRFWIPVVFLMVALYCILVPTVNSVSVIMCLQILPGFSTGVLYSYLTSEAMTEVPAYQKSTAMGFYQAVYALGMTVLPILAGYIAEHVHMTVAYYVLAILAVVGSVGGYLYYKKQY